MFFLKHGVCRWTQHVTLRCVAVRYVCYVLKNDIFSALFDYTVVTWLDTDLKNLALAILKDLHAVVLVKLTKL